MWAEIAFWLYVNLCVILGLVLTSKYPSMGSFAVAFIPFFVLFGSLFFGSLFLFVCFTIFIEAEAMEKRMKEKEQNNDQNEDRESAEGSESDENESCDNPADRNVQQVKSPTSPYPRGMDPNAIPTSPCISPTVGIFVSGKNFEELHEFSP